MPTALLVSPGMVERLGPHRVHLPAVRHGPHHFVAGSGGVTVVS